MLTSHLPLLSLVDSSAGSTLYDGLVSVHVRSTVFAQPTMPGSELSTRTDQGDEYRMTLQLPPAFRPGRSLKGTLLWTDDRLSDLLRGLQDLLQQVGHYSSRS